ncbi:MAG: DUF4412 domain-containing protein [Nitrospirota bacterium]
MCKKFIFLLALAVAFLFITSSSYAFEYSADTVITASGEKTYGKMYAKPDRFRMEITNPQSVITITRMDKKIVWNIMPSEKMYMEMPFDPKTAPKTEIRGEIDRKLVGSEKIDGHPTEKYLITYKEGAKTEKMYQWWATDINFPIKSADLNNEWVQEYKNIKMGPQPDKLFEAPAGYSKMQMPMMPKGMKFE